MKRTKRVLWMIGLFALSLFVVAAEDAGAATLDMNGIIMETAQSDGDVVMENGTTLVSEDFLEEMLYLQVDKQGTQFSLNHAAGAFSIDGAIGEDTLSFAGKEVPLSVAASENEGALMLPLRPLLELFGTVEWSGENQCITVRYDYNDQMTLPDVTLAERPLEVRIDRESEMAEDLSWRPIRTTEDGMLVETYDDRFLAAITAGGENVIVPLHPQHAILDGAYAVEDDYLYWVEYPTAETAEDQQWYLYVQERGAEPVCVDQGDFAALKTISFGEYILQNCDFRQGNIIWLRADGATKELQVRLYQHDSGETTILESASLAERPNMTMEVALGENDAVWTKCYIVESAREYGTMYRYHLDTDEREVFSEGLNLLAPTITGDYLVTRLKPKGNNFILNLETGECQSGVLWVYDLVKDEWMFRVTADLPEWEDNLILNVPSVLDESHIVLNIEGGSEKNEMVVVDLEHAQALHLQNDDGSLLYCAESGWNDGLVRKVQPLGTDGTALMTMMKQTDEGMVFPIYPVHIVWS